MIREQFAGRPFARERRHGGGFGHRHFGGKFVLRRRGLQFLQRQFKLIQQPRGTLRARAIAVTVQLLDLQLQMGDQRLVVGGLGFGDGRLRFRDNPSAALDDQCRFQRFDVIWQSFNTSFHKADGITKSAICGDFFCTPELFLSLARALRSPGMLRISPVDRL
jgi:hypothetical protein